MPDTDMYKIMKDSTLYHNEHAMLILGTQFAKEVKRRSDRLMDYFLIGYFLIGLGLAFYYDTWLIALVSGGLSLLAYYSVKLILPGSDLYQYILSVVLGIFMAQYIYQMHGLFEMHFFAFIGSVILITYQNWKLQIPMLVVVVIHHALFGYLQNIGFTNVYFTQLDYLELQTFIIHIILAAMIFFICGLWAYQLKKAREKQVVQAMKIDEQKEALFQMEHTLNEESLAEAHQNAEQARQHSEQLEKSLKEISDYKRALDESSIVAITDQKGIINFVNGNFCRISKYSAEELIGQDHRIINSGYHTKEFLGNLWTTIAKGKIWRGEIRNKAKDGTLYWVDTTIVPFLNAEKKPYQYVAIRNDITERKKAEQARDEAEQANQAKSVFLAMMSHEIRTPMNGVIGMASLLSETQLSPEQREYTEIIKSSGENLLSVINDVLDFSKIESDNMVMENTDFDLRSCIEDVLDLFGSKASQAGLDLIYQIDHNVPPQIIGDSLRLKQVLINLVGNALKFTNRGEVFVGVHVLQIEGEHCILGFEVSDTGIGIPPGKIERLFKVFTQVDSSTTRRYGGTGLGLVISEKLVKLMGGSIAVKSVEGQGTTFTFSISTQISVKPIQTYVTCNMAAIEGKKVLIVDDNATNRNVLKGQLEHWKLETTLARSGNEALEILTKMPDLDLVLMDMDMPEMDGVQTGRFIKKSYPILPIILLSSIGDERRSTYSDLFSSILTKPVKQNTLCQHIINELRNKGKSGLKSPDAKQVLSAEFASQYPMRILVVEDNPVNQKLTGRILNKLGYQVEMVENGQEALNAVKKEQYDVILMDVQMPKMDGLEATRQIRMQRIVQPVIIAMTANAIQGDRDECLDAGMDDYVTKPVVLDVLVRALEKWALVVRERTERIL